jgi:hypothetical protein
VTKTTPSGRSRSRNARITGTGSDQVLDDVGERNEVVGRVLGERGREDVVLNVAVDPRAARRPSGEMSCATVRPFGVPQFRRPAHPRRGRADLENGDRVAGSRRARTRHAR